jgi:hypothetical protein
MQASFTEFEEEFGGKVFNVWIVKEKIINKTVIEEIRDEIDRLKK